MPLESAKGSLLPKQKEPDTGVATLKRVLGANQKVFRVGAGDWTLPLVVDAEALGASLSPEDIRTLGLLPELLRDPFEVWSGFFQDEGTGQIVLRHSLVKGVDVGEKAYLLMAQGNGKGVLDTWTCLPKAHLQDLNGHRRGLLIYGR